MSERIKSALYIVSKVANCVIHAIEALHNSCIYAVKALTKCLLNASLTKRKVVEVCEDCGVVKACGKVCYCCTWLATTARTARATVVNDDRLCIALTTTVSTAVTALTTPTSTKCEEKNDNPILLS